MTAELPGIVLAVGAAAIESLAQLCLKLGAGNGAWAIRWIVRGALAYAAEVLVYTLALHFLDVSLAFPLGALGFVGVALLSRIFLGERVGRIRWAGIACILAGAICVTL